MRNAYIMSEGYIMHEVHIMSRRDTSLFFDDGGVDPGKTHEKKYNGNNDYPVRKLRFLTPLHRRGISGKFFLHSLLNCGRGVSVGRGINGNE